MKRNAHRGGRQAVFPAQKLRLRNTASLRCMHEKRQLLPGEAPLSSRLSVRPFCTYVRSCPFVGAPFEYLYMLMPGGVSWRDTLFVVNPGWPPRVKVTRRPGGSMPETEIFTSDASSQELSLAPLMDSFLGFSADSIIDFHEGTPAAHLPKGRVSSEEGDFRYFLPFRSFSRDWLAKERKRFSGRPL